MALGDAVTWLLLLGILTVVAVLVPTDEVKTSRTYRWIDRGKGWAGYATVVVGSTVPLLLGPGIVTENRRLVVLGYGVAMMVFALGVAGVVVGTSHRREYAALRAGTDRRSGEIGADQEGPVTVSGRVDDVATTRFGPWAEGTGTTNAAVEYDRPAYGTDDWGPGGGTGPFPLAPFTGVEAVAVEWVYQKRGGFGRGEGWRNEAWGSLSVPFGLTDGDASVVVDPSAAQLLTRGAQVRLTLAADRELPSLLAAFVRHRDDLPDPEDRDGPVRITERWVLAEAPVTVVGYPTEGLDPETADGEAIDPAFAAGRPVLGDGGEGEGDLAAATRSLRRRFVWLTVAGEVLAIVGLGAGFLVTLPNVPIV